MRIPHGSRVPLRRLLSPRPLLVLLCAALSLCLSAQARAQMPKILVELPVVYNAPDVERLAPGLRSMLASRLSRPGVSVVTEADPATSSTWVVRTTITRLGSLYSVDVALEPTAASGEKTRRAFEKSETLDGLLAALETVARRLTESVDAPPEEPRPARAEPPRSEVPRTDVPRSAAAPAEGRLAQALRSPRIGASIRGEAKSLAVGDLDADGAPEILLIVEGEILTFRDHGGKIEPVGKPLRPGGFEPLLLSIGDVDRDGGLEIFVAGAVGTSPVTQAYRWSASGLVPKGSTTNGFLKAVAHPDRGPLLLGMTPGGGNALFSPGIRVFVPKAGGYEPGEKFPAPEAAEVINTDWLRLADGAPAFAVVTSESEYLRIHDANGARVFQSADPVKGSRNLLVGPEQRPGTLDGEIYRVQGRSVLWEGASGERSLLLPVNQSSSFRAAPRSPTFSHGQVVAFRWDGLTLLQEAAGPKIPGFIPDVDLWTPPKGSAANRPTLYGVLVRSEGLVLRKYESKLLAYEL